MAITTVNELDRAMRRSQRFMLHKFSRGNSSSWSAGSSHWVSSGNPGGGSYPVSVTEVCNHLTTGAIPFIQQQSPRKTYIAGMSATIGALNDHLTADIYDRLIHTAAVSSNVDTLQSAGADLATFLATSNIDERKGHADYSEVLWTYESIGTHGATPSNATINVTYHDGSTGDLDPFVANGLTSTFILSLLSIIPVADQGKYIRGVNSIIYSAAAGNVGGTAHIVASRYRASSTTEFALMKAPFRQWDDIALPEIHNSSCLYLRSVYNGTTTGTVSGEIHFVYG